MNDQADDRVPVRFGPPRGDEAVLVEGDADVPSARVVARFRLAPARRGHPAFCSCCVPRGAVAEALARLFLARARGEAPWFCSVAVLATPEGLAAVRAALADDQVSRARYVLSVTNC